MTFTKSNSAKTHAHVMTKKKMNFSFGTKAATLAQLRQSIKTAKLCDQEIINVQAWEHSKSEVIAHVLERFSTPLAVRSSATSEDTKTQSNAGAHLSLIGVPPDCDDLEKAISEVFSSYLEPSEKDEVLIQPMVNNVAISGVVMTRDLDTGGPYYVVNYDDFSGRTDTVTSGGESKTILVHRTRIDALRSSRFRALIQSIIEVEEVTKSTALDIEFCITDNDENYILQVRPMAVQKKWTGVSDDAIEDALDQVREKIAATMQPQPTISGHRTILSEMADWNPAEIIGNTPKPLALSLYKNLITDQVWAGARRDMGYRYVDQPLLIDLHGRPYIDVRLSFNSFLPADIDPAVADRLVNTQLAMLAADPSAHDKVEFDIAVTCHDFAFEQRRQTLLENGVSNADANALKESLHALTAKILLAGKALPESAPKQATDLYTASNEIESGVERARVLLDRCREQGTPHFSIMARHGFIGVLFLRSLVTRGVLTPAQADGFLRGVHTVATEFVSDLARLQSNQLEQKEFLGKYGHLRPGTYNISSWRYDERPDLFSGGSAPKTTVSSNVYTPDNAILAQTDALLKAHSYPMDAQELFDYIARAVRAREQAKFAFTRDLSEALSIIASHAESNGISRHDISFVPLPVLLTDPSSQDLKESIRKEQEAYRVARTLHLPHLITERVDIDVVRMPLGKPTFITSKSVTAKSIILRPGNIAPIDGQIVVIESADPGFDWIFSHNILGLVTKYGGANSHMAIRCTEFGLPAAIGCGKRIFDALSRPGLIDLDCAARTVRHVENH